LVIGKGGSTIQAMQRETGARLFVDNATRVLHLSGSSEQVERATKRIHDLLARAANSPRYNY
jgi:polyribonucleotide nucleotidyltransferase